MRQSVAKVLTALRSRPWTVACLLLVATLCPLRAAETLPPSTGNPVFSGWYADPEAAVFDKQYWIFPTFSAPYEKQTFLDAFSSPDLVHWTKHPHVIDTAIIPWAKRAMWAPAVSHKDGKYYVVFAANDIQNDHQSGGLGVAVADRPEGPYHDHLGKPLVDKFQHGAQPIDPFVFTDPKDKQAYLIFGGWRHCVVGKLRDDYKGFVPFSDGETFHEITPQGYVEGPCMFVRNGKYYFMWSEGAWTTSTYNVAYAVGDSPLGPFKRLGTVLQPDPAVGNGAGHNSIIGPGPQDKWFIVYHRHPPGETDGNGRVTCVERMNFNPDGTIQPVRITNEGVGVCPLP